MELPPLLREGVDRILDGVSVADIRNAAETVVAAIPRRNPRRALPPVRQPRRQRLSRHPPARDLRRHSRQPVRVADIRPGWEPQSLLDIGAGPGSVFWAACDQWPSIERATMIEGCDPIRRVGEAACAARGGTTDNLDRRRYPARIAGARKRGPGDAVLCHWATRSGCIGRLTERLWQTVTDVLLVVEPGTPAGWQRILRVRDRLIALGAHIVAPCTHAERCPLAAPDWCHFSRRVARSRMHRLAKDGDVPWEDEKFIYLAASRAADRDAGGACAGAPAQQAPASSGSSCAVSDRTAGRTRGDEAARRRFQSGAPLDWGRLVARSDRVEAKSPAQPGSRYAHARARSD